jgi:superfamily II DNA or RNA helicase
LKPTLRPYQSEALAAVFDALIEDYKSVLLTAATGTGKTVIFAEIVMYFLKEYKWRVLVLAPRTELIQQAYLKIRDMCGLYDERDIDKEQGNNHFCKEARVVIGSRQTCYRENRLTDWVPDVIITDEAHEANCDSYRAIYARFPNALLVGVTATGMRGDGQPVFAEHIDGKPVIVKDRKTKKPRPCAIDEAPFHKHVYKYELRDAVNDGWLVEPIGYKVKTGVDISAVKSQVGTSGDSDFSQVGLNRVLEASEKVIADRINRAITKWKEVASDRPTLVFCSSVEYAKWAAKLWNDAGYKSQSIDANTPELERADAIGKIHRGEVQVTTNFGIYTQGTDVDKWSCIVMLRPTESPGLFMQMLGRGTRPLDPVGYTLGCLDSAAKRIRLISDSPKSDCIVIDVVDIAGKHEICTLPNTLGLPRDLDLQGKGLMAAASLVEKFQEHGEQVEHECPATFEELEATLQQIDLLNKSGAKRGDWLISKDGSYYYAKAPVGYQARFTRAEGDKEAWNLRVVDTRTGEVFLDKTRPRTKGELRDYFNSASQGVQRAIEAYKKTLPVVPNSQRLEKKDGYWVYTLAHLSRKQVDAIPFDKVQDIIKEQKRLYRERKWGVRETGNK